MYGTNICICALLGLTAVVIAIASSALLAAPAPFATFILIPTAGILIWFCGREIREELGDSALLGVVASLPLFSSVMALTILELVGTRCCVGIPGSVTPTPNHPCLCGFLGENWFRRSLDAMFPVLAGDPRLPYLTVLVVLNGTALLSSFLLLRGIAHVFGQRGLRLSALAMAATAVIWAAWSRFPEGSEQLPDWPDPIRGGWTAALLVLLGGGYLWLEATAVRREPSVQVSSTKTQDNEATRKLNHEVRSRLPAIEVLAPAWKPGAPPGHAVAAIVESSDLPGSRVTSALMRVFALVLPVPPSYGVRVRADGPEGNAPEDNGYVSATVEVHDRISGKTLHQTTLPALRSDLAAIRAAGFVASRVFAEDPLIPEWAKGRYEGEDLAAYLMARELPRLDRRYWGQGPTDPYQDYETFHAMQQDRIDILRRAADSRRASGVVRYELASLYEQKGEHVKALRLHAVNRAQYSSKRSRNKIFQRSRYRMVVLLKMIANHRFAEVWNAADPQDLRDIFHALRLAGLMTKSRTFEDLEEEEFVSPEENRDGPRRIRIALLRIAKAEACAMDRHFSRRRMFCEDVRWHGKNPYSVLPPGINSQESPWRRRKYYNIGFRLLHGSIASRIASAEGRLPVYGHWWLQRHRQEEELKRIEEDIEEFRKLNPGWGQWGITYNKASLIATQKLESGIPLAPEERAEAVDEVIAALREALNPSACEHYRPSELLARDPDLECMQNEDKFVALLEEQYKRDWQTKPPFPRSLGQELVARRTRPFTEDL
ncbi:hypothetical protein KIK06_05605 [Nocardiopsis sp. EMB25]|uniref:hypothetical protein n=1 Tax=Nocardiopsis sp. EMB25 TaxID=2835867 RepID=UPI002283E700|nr:hypothetical protein [Nocardiopsis sp. EMB25]MCY9783370.1 hypothetical protein [Nocardiopsis sp. EMB25]